MSEPGRESDPYAPPRSEVEVSPVEERKLAGELSRGEMVWLRVVGGCLGVVMVSSKLLELSGEWMARLIGVGLWCLVMMVVVMGARRSRLVLGLFLLVCVVGNGYFLVRVYEIAKVGGSGVVMELLRMFGVTAVCLWVSLGCALGLFVMRWRRG